jgi:ubiquinone/menaquinone biosynthesis C-methylase UbiE
MSAASTSGRSISGGAPRAPRRAAAPRAAAPRAAAPRAAAAAPDAPPPLLARAVAALFRLSPVLAAASAAARAKIVGRGAELGLDFAGEVAALRATGGWPAAIAAAADPAVLTPDYYRRAFHAYPEGNLSLDAAMEVTVASRSVHATVFDEAGKALDPTGDARLRASYSACMLELLGALGARPVADVLDVGAATGLSSLELLRALPGGVAVTGIDLSPHFLAVGRRLQAQRAPGERLALVHAAAEATGLPSSSFDLVSVCLVLHELPAAASRAVFAEAFRLLRPGGALAIMEMNPQAPAFQRLLASPVPMAIFASTEPYLQEYISLDVAAALEGAGFSAQRQLENSPRHRTVVAVKLASVLCGCLELLVK